MVKDLEKCCNSVLEKINEEIEACKNIEKARGMQKFFKTGKGEYGERDVFLGISTPDCRDIVKKYDLTLEEIGELLKSKEHEKRTIALSLLIKMYNKAIYKKEIVDFYLANTEYINNWDLVDISCYKIVGDYVYNTKDYYIIRKLAKSKNLWERRIAIISTMVFAKKGESELIFETVKPMLKGEHDLVNKAVGWILRELWKENNAVVERFIEDNIHDFSSITLNYTMEKFDKEKKARFRDMRKNG